MIASAFGRAVKLLHGVPVNCCLLESMAIGAWLEVDNWLVSCAPRARLELASGRLRKLWTENSTPASGQGWVGLWPSDLTGASSSSRISKGFVGYASIQPATEQEEKNIIAGIISDLNSKMAAGLSTEFSVSRTVAVPEDKGQDTLASGPVYIVIGASHAGRIAEELEEAGGQLINLTRSGWRPTRENVQLATLELNRALKTVEGREVRIVYQLLDNSIFLAEKDGATTLPVRLEDGLYHVVGKLVLLDTDGVKDLVNNILPLLKAGGEHRKMIVAPIQRYVAAPCCRDPYHVTTYLDPAYSADMAAGLKRIRETLRCVIYKRSVRNFRVSSGEKLLGWEEGVTAATLKALWGTDPVHLATAGYREMARRLRDLFNSEAPFTHSGDKPDTSMSRANWIRHDEASAVNVGGGGRGGWGGAEAAGGHITRRSEELSLVLFCIY